VQPEDWLWEREGAGGDPRGNFPEPRGVGPSEWGGAGLVALDLGVPSSG
jgi:hypothetical protein